MILAVNIGNTNFRAAVGQNNTVSETVFRVDKCSTSGQFIRLLEQNLGGDVWKKVDGSIISSVVPNRTPFVMEAIAGKTGKTPQRIDVTKCGLNIKHYNGLVGEDRVVSCAGAMQKYTAPFIVVDFGTATTINVVSGNTEFLGGAILAGVQIGLYALSGNTALLPQIDIAGDVPVIGKSTIENLLSGAVIGAACAVGGYVSRIERELDCKMTKIITGGHAPVVLPHIDFECNYEPDLLLNGLFAMYSRN